MDCHRQPIDIYSKMALNPTHLFTTIVAATFSRIGILDTLSI